MKKIFQRALSGVLSVLFVGQVLIYGDGSSQGIAHAETIADIKESLELSGTVLVIYICFGVIPKNRLFAAFIIKMNDMLSA